MNTGTHEERYAGTESGMLLVCHTNVEGFKFVMPAKAGIQRHSALASGYTS
jgi:hypothetical protein